MHVLTFQYELIKEAREVVFEYCEHFSGSDYIAQLDNFNKKSIRDLHVHVANVYLHWLPIFAQQRPVEYFNAEEVTNVKEIREAYKKVNACVSDFIDQFKDQMDMLIVNKLPRKDQVLKLTPVQLVTHGITHEFHHKGQILSMGRMLGYIPPDADIIRT